ncbi:serine hydrolase [Terrabacter sp. NPDC000476]|uniref:D-alanyl-D-alanine carboxypeptidase family protein n=1 Tax=Terrabacter sp. NPDC000476 TaxID=3154258 RepID=UPI0033272FBE
MSLGALVSIALATPTTAYAGSSPAVAGAPAAPAASPACRPWQVPTTVPPGVVLTPRVFPTDEVRATATPAAPTGPPTGSASTAGRPHATPTPAPEPRVVCRNAPPKPFAHPQWAPDSVVGGAQLASDGVVVDAPPATPAPPEVYDVSYVVADLDSGEILAAKSPHAWLRPASTLKTLTALTLLPRLDPRRVVVAKEDAQSAAGSRVGILAGNRYPVSALVDAMLMFSANDAVYALADAAGGYDRTVALMNEEAARIGAHDTLTVDPSGLDEGAQRSSAYDLALIGRNAMRLPSFRAAIVKRDTVFPGGKDRSGKVWPAFHVYNINELLRHYPGTIGIKPGRTDRAQHTFIGAATRGGRTLVVAQMGSVTGSWKPTAALLDWGFANADRVTPVGRLVEPGEATPPTAAPAIPRLPTGPDGPDGPDGSVTATNPGTEPSTPTGTPQPVAAADAGTPVDDGTMTLAGIALLGLVVTGGGALAVPALRSRRRGRHRT